MIVVSDTSAVTTLIQIGKVELMSRLYERVIIPVAVEKELLREHPVLPSFLELLPVKHAATVARFSGRLDAGESEAITLMLEGCGDWLLIDERMGRRVAQGEGIKVIGLLGLLVDARRSGMIASFPDVIEQLENVAGFRISKELKTRLLREDQLGG